MIRRAAGLCSLGPYAYIADAMTIVTTHYRYKRPPQKRKPNPAALAMPTIVHAKTPKPGRVSSREDTSDQASKRFDTSDRAAPANDDRKSAIVTVRSRKHARFGDAPEMTPEEHKRRGDAADALFREMKRRIAEKDRS